MKCYGRALLASAWVLLLPVVVIAQPAPPLSSPPFDLEATDITFDASGTEVVATGNPVTVHGEAGQVQAKRVRYLVAENRLLAEDDVVFTNPEGTTLRVNRLELTGDLKQGALEQLRLALPGLGEVSQASRAEISGTELTFHQVKYSPCQRCGDKALPWQIEAREARYNQAAGTMTYRDATLDIYGVPVAYVPWFRHPLGTDKPQSGLVPPSFGRSETLGDQVSLGAYLWSPTENADYTFNTRLMSSRGAQLILERRQVGTNLTTELKTSMLNDSGLPAGVGSLRSHAELKAQYNLSEQQRIGVNASVASDDGYLNQFFERNDPYLTSTAFWEWGAANTFVGGNIKHFQDLNPRSIPAQTAQVMPQLQLRHWWALGPAGGQLEVNGDLLQLNRGEGTDTHRMANRLAYSVPWWLDDGSKVTFGATGRADFYSISGRKNGVLTRLLPEATVMWEKPYLNASGEHQLVPQVLAAVSPRGGNLASKIPNEDSVAYELETTNLFEPSRFAGLDRVETGPRLVYGLDSRWGPVDDTRYRLFVGQSVRQYDDNALPLSGGASTRASDWVADAEANPVSWFGVNNRLRLDNSSWQLRRLDSGLRLGQATTGPRLNATYSFLDERSDNLNTQMTLPLSANWELRGRSQHDFRTDSLLEAEAGLTWLRDCYAIEFLARRKGFVNNNLKPSNDYLINFQLLTLGRGVGFADDSR